MKLLLLVFPLFGLIEAQYPTFYENLAKFKQIYHANSCLQNEAQSQCKQTEMRALRAINNNCGSQHVSMGYENRENCVEKLSEMFKYNLQIQKPNAQQKVTRPPKTLRKSNQHRHSRVNKNNKNKNKNSDELGVINYDDYNAVLNAEDDHKPTEFKSDEIKSSSEENYDEDFWRKKDSRETLLKDIDSVEKEVGVEQSVDSFKSPKIVRPKEQYGHIGDELIKKHKWLSTINPLVYVNNGELHFPGPTFSDKSVLLKLKPIPTGPGQVVFTCGNGIPVNFFQRKTSCGIVGINRKLFVCIKPLNIHIRVRSTTSDKKFIWDLVCLQVYLPSWKFGYEFCYNADTAQTVRAFDGNEDEYFRKMRLFVFNGGTYDNWVPKFLDRTN